MRLLGLSGGRKFDLGAELSLVDDLKVEADEASSSGEDGVELDGTIVEWFTGMECMGGSPCLGVDGPASELILILSVGVEMSCVKVLSTPSLGEPQSSTFRSERNLFQTICGGLATIWLPGIGRLD